MAAKDYKPIKRCATPRMRGLPRSEPVQKPSTALVAKFPPAPGIPRAQKSAAQDFSRRPLLAAHLLLRAAPQAREISRRAAAQSQSHIGAAAPLRSACTPAQNRSALGEKMRGRP